jgi:phage gp29-like protein
MKYMPKPVNNPVASRFSEIMQSYRSLISGAPQAPRLTPDTRGFYHVDNTGALTTHWSGIDKLFYTLVMGVVEDPDFALRKDPRVYERMLRDPQIYYCLEVRKAATIGLPWIITPPNEFQKDPMGLQYAQASERRILRIPRFSELLNNTLDALLPGLSVNELVWRLHQRGNIQEYIVCDHYPVNKDRVRFDKDGNPRLLSRRSPVQGEPFPAYKFLTHRFNISDGSWAQPQDWGYVYYGRGLADTPLYHYFYFKITALRFLLKSLERYGDPFKLFYTGAQNAALASKAHEILASLQNDSSVVIPGKRGEVNVELPRPGSSGGLFVSFLEYIDKAITRSILGQELMTEMPATGSGSYAAAQVHASVFSRLVESDKSLLEDTLNNTLMKYDAHLNTPNLPEEIRPLFKFRAAALTDTQGFLSTVAQAASLGLTISEAQVRELTGLREPLPGEAILGAPPITEAVDVKQDESASHPRASTRGGNGNGSNDDVSSLQRARFRRS